MNIQENGAQGQNLSFCFFPILQVPCKLSTDQIKHVLDVFTTFNSIPKTIAEPFSKACIDIAEERRNIYELMAHVKQTNSVIDDRNFSKYEILEFNILMDTLQWIEKQMLVTEQFERTLGLSIFDRSSSFREEELTPNLLHIIEKIKEVMQKPEPLKPRKRTSEEIEIDFKKMMSDKKDNKKPKNGETTSIQNLLDSNSSTDYSFLPSAFDNIKGQTDHKIQTLMTLNVIPLTIRLEGSSFFASSSKNIYYYDLHHQAYSILTSLIGILKYSHIDCFKNWLVTANQDCVTVYKKEEGKYETVQSFSSLDSVQTVKISEQLLAQGNNKGNVSLYQFNTGSPSEPVFADVPLSIFDCAKSSAITALDILEDEKYLFTGSSDKYIKVWDVEKKAPTFEHKFRYTIQTIKSLSSYYFLVGDIKGTIKLFDLRSNENLDTINLKEEISEIQAFDVTTACVASSSGYLRVYDLRKNQLKNSTTLIREDNPIVSVDCDDHQVVYCTNKGKICHLEFRGTDATSSS
jgi:WD40 repeat protein